MNMNMKVPDLTVAIEQRIRTIIGDLMINNAALNLQVESLQRELEELKKERKEGDK